MTKTDMAIKYMGIKAYLNVMEKDIQDKIKVCSSNIDYCATELQKFYKKRKKRYSFNAQIAVMETDLNWSLDIRRQHEKNLMTIKTMTQKLIKIIEENKNKEEIPDEIFNELFELFSIIQGETDNGKKV